MVWGVKMFWNATELKYQLKTACFIHRLLFMNFTVIINQKPTLDTHTKKREKEFNTVTLLEVLIILMTLAKANRLRSRKFRDNDP